MDMANYTAWRLGLADRRVYEEIHPVLSANFTGFEHADISLDALLAGLRKDKKNIGDDVMLILPREPGGLIRHRHSDAGQLRDICDEYLTSLRGSVAAH